MSIQPRPQTDPPQATEPSPAPPKVPLAVRLRESWMSYGLIGSFVVVYLIGLVVQAQTKGFNLRLNSEVLFLLGANFSLAFSAGQFWRLFTSCFLHLDALHLLMNSMALQYFGPLLERSFSPWRMLLAFVLTGLAGSLTSTLLHLGQPYLSAGASGGLYGLFGVIFTTGKRYAKHMDPSFQTWLNQTLGAMVIFSFIPGIDIWAHFGGLGAGLILGLFYRPRPRFEALIHDDKDFDGHSDEDFDGHSDEQADDPSQAEPGRVRPSAD